MASIKKKRVTIRPVKSICTGVFESAKYYGSMAWKRLRSTYYNAHPICEECLEHHHIEPADDVHHLVPFSTGTTEEECWDLFLSEHNLRCLCKACHMAYHTKMKHYGLKRCDGLTDIEWSQVHEQDQNS